MKTPAILLSNGLHDLAGPGANKSRPEGQNIVLTDSHHARMASTVRNLHTVRCPRRVNMSESRAYMDDVMSMSMSIHMHAVSFGAGQLRGF